MMNINKYWWWCPLQLKWSEKVLPPYIAVIYRTQPDYDWVLSFFANSKTTN